jgi:hypothetical protein
MEEQTKNENLMEVVASHNIQAVQDCLQQGADPNYTRFKDEEEPNGYIQPTTPLRLVMFCISDALLDDNSLKQFAEIAKLLLQYGADPKPAMEIAEWRYGKYDPNAEESLFMDVWRIVAETR